MSSVQELARRIARLEHEQRVGQVAPQLGSSSLDDESINVYDEDGNAKARVGYQHDGTYTSAELDGPVPPVPAGPTAKGGSAALTVAWGGRYTDDARAPLDFRLVEIYASLTAFTDRNDAFLLGHFSNEAGGELTVARPVGTWHVGLVTKAESGRRSAVSALVTADVVSVVDQALIDQLVQALEDLEIDLGELAFAFTTSEDEPTVADGAGKPEGAYWTRINTAGEQVGRWRWTGTVWVDAPLGAEFIPELGVSKLVADQAGFNVAVVNELFADMFTAHKITAEHADLQSFLADTGWVGDMRTSILTASSVPPDALKLGMDELLPDPMFERETQPVGSPFVYSPSYTEGGQARTLAVTGQSLTSASRFYLSDSKVATPDERYILRAKLRTTQRDYGVALGLEIQDADGVKVADVIIPSRIDAPLVDPDPDPDPVDPDDPVEPEDPDDDPFEYPLGEYFNVDGVAVVPAGGFRVRPWIGLQPGDTATSANWFVSSVSWRDVPSTTDAEGWVAQLTTNGLQVISPEGTDAVQLGNFTVRGLTLYNNETELDEDGEPVLGDDGEPVVNEVPTVSLTDDGYVGAHEIAANESLTYRGVEMQDTLDALPRGAVAQYVFDEGRRGPYADRTGIGFVRFMAEPGRSYKITSTSQARNRDGKGAMVYVTIQQNFNAYLTPNIIGTDILEDTTVSSNKYSDNWFFTADTNTIWVAPEDDDDRLRYVTLTLSIGPLSGTGDIEYSRGSLSVEDVGVAFESEGGYHRGGASGAPPAGETQDPPPPPPKKQTYKRRFNYRWVKSWQGNGSAPSAIQSMAYQGRSPNYPAGGVYRSMVGIQSMTSYLSGATVKKVRVRVRMDHSHSNTGGRVVIGTHSHSSKPSAFSGYNWNVVNSWFRRGQTKWVTLPRSTHAGFKNGSRRGIVFYTSSGKSKYYAKMSAGVTAIEVTYEK